MRAWDVEMWADRLLRDLYRQHTGGVRGSTAMEREHYEAWLDFMDKSNNALFNSLRSLEDEAMAEDRKHKRMVSTS
jgi:hypothetical protein